MRRSDPIDIPRTLSGSGGGERVRSAFNQGIGVNYDETRRESSRHGGVA